MTPDKAIGNPAVPAASTSLKVAIIALRIAVGAVFIVSGFAKADDLWGSIFKIEEYLEVWGWAVPRTIVLVGSFALSLAEFLCGALLLLGCYRRSAPFVLLLMMAFMLPLTAWIWIADPVSDCGCFGEMIVLSNAASFVKNVILTVCLVWLLVYNRRVAPFFNPYSQWIVAALLSLYLLIVSVEGYSVQPLVDFRRFPVGTMLLPSEDADEAEIAPEYEFIYERDGRRQAFSADDLPDSTWTFVDRHLIAGSEDAAADGFTVYDDGEDATADAIAAEGEQMLVVIPDLRRVDPGQTFAINELDSYMAARGGSLTALLAPDSRGIDYWQDISMATYPIYTAEPTLLKELVRGKIGIVMLRDGVIVWKRTLGSIVFNDHHYDDNAADILDDDEMSRSDINPVMLTGALLILLFILWVIDRAGITLHRIVSHRLQEKWLNLQPKSKNKNNSNVQFIRPMRKKIVAGNWKMNTTLEEGIQLAEDINVSLKGKELKCEVVICVPFTHLTSVNAIIDKDILAMGAENCAAEAKGAYTGEVSAAMVKSTGATHVILGHSERRQYYGETSEILKQKVDLALANDLTPIFCVGEVLEERESGVYNDVVVGQLRDALFSLTPEQFSRIVIAYEPVWAIGTGKTATAEQAEDMHAVIRNAIRERYGAEIADNCSILYGGSCKPGNAREIFAKPDVDGGLIGGAALDPQSFLGIIEAW